MLPMILSGAFELDVHLEMMSAFQPG